ncbi:MAG: methylcrotonoyl-CoA carboxylase, partial [SAR324 cluster bacterium]|nr:methylcrotonoyl-CoA carboxylase [SAR324 cluster bacterium]
SLQRRHQKIIEESPSPFMDDELRLSMADAAVAAAKAVKYTGAGTVEFIVGDDREFFFMEMNTRLQVEHPVTEMITGLDLVEWQLRIAAGEKLPLTQHEVHQTGHAIEARIYAENPKTGFLPSIGTLHCLAFPDIFHKVKKIEDNNSQSWSSIRIDSGVEQGGKISIHYDPLIAKLVVHADSRKQAIRTMQNTLAQSGILGVETNLGFLQNIMQHPDFEAAKTDTLFVDSNLESLLEENQDSVDWVCWGAAIACLLEDFAESETKAWESIEPCSPWNSLKNWRASFPEPHRVQLRNQQGTEKEVMIIKENNSFRILNETGGILVTVSRHGDLLDLSWNTNGLEESGHHLLVLMNDLQVLTVHEKGRNYFTRLDPLAYEQSEEVSDFRLSAPMPGNVIRVLVKAGDEVSSGQPLLVMEAMKMEHTIVAPANGIVEEVLFQPGDIVQNDAKLVKFSLLEE